MKSHMIYALSLFFWLALHTSQSLMDLADGLMVFGAIFLATKNREWRNLIQAWRPISLWPFWLAVLILGYVSGASIQPEQAFRHLWEFRWFLSFLCYIYLFKKIAWDQQKIYGFTVILAGLGLIDLFLYCVNFHQDPRAGGLFGHSMPFAHSMGPAALFLLFHGLFNQEQKVGSRICRVLSLLAPLLASLLVILSLTRGVWIGFTMAFLVGSAFLGRRIFLQSILGIFLVAGILFLGSGRIQDRVMGRTNAESQSNNERWLFWQANIEMFKDYPLFGIGYGQNNKHLESYLQRQGVEGIGGAHAHNQYFHFLAGTGFLGLSCYLYFLFILFWDLLKNLYQQRVKRDLSGHYYIILGIFSGLFCFVIGSLTESNFSIAKNRYMFLFLAALGWALNHPDVILAKMESTELSKKKEAN